MEKGQFRCILHGSFRKHFEEIKRVHALFSAAGIKVLAPELSEIRRFDAGFAILESEAEKDPRLVELIYLQNLKRLGEDGFSYFVDPDGYIGKSASYELGIAQVSNIRCFFMERPKDHPVYVYQNSIWKPEALAEHIGNCSQLPQPKIKRNESALHKMWENLMVPGSVVAAGGIIEYAGGRANKEREVLLVRTHKWGGRYSIVGGKVRRNERLDEALIREVKEETGLSCEIGGHICTFDQIKNSGYWKTGIQHIFVDKVVRVASRRVRLNEEAQACVWMPAGAALRDLPMEPNARHTLQLYADNSARI